MKKIKVMAILVIGMFLFLSLGYAQQLSDKERSIFYEAAWLALQAEYQIAMDQSGAVEDVEAKMRDFMSQNNLTEDQLKDIINKGNQMPFTSAEEQLSRDMDKEITDKLAPNEIMDVLKNLANKYNMSIGQVSSVFTRRIAKK